MENSPFRNPGVIPEEGDAYADLAEFGITYNSTMADVHRAGIKAMQQGPLTASRARAQNYLRNAEKRLVLDLLYFQPDASVFGNHSVGHGPAGSPEQAPDLWRLLFEAWDSKVEDLPPLEPPGSFLEESDEQPD